MIVLIGKTASGKTAVVNELVKRGFNKIVTTTTRPPRRKEKQDVDYHFVTREEFEKMVYDRKFAEWKSYDSAEGTWFYGTAYEDLEQAKENSIIIVTPAGCEELYEQYKDKMTVLYIYANNQTIKERLKKRGDTKEESTRRITSDNEDFKNAAHLAERIFYNNSDKDLDELINEILEYLKSKHIKGGE